MIQKWLNFVPFHLEHDWKTDVHSCLTKLIDPKVVAFTNEKCDKSRRSIRYLTKYGDPLLEEIMNYGDPSRICGK